MRLIDADWILGEIDHGLGCYEIGDITQEDGLYVELRDVVKMVCAAPTIDAVPVVRCKDCKHYRNHPNGMCYAWTEPYDNERGYKGDTHCVEPDDFCSYGERKDNG